MNPMAHTEQEIKEHTGQAEKQIDTQTDMNTKEKKYVFFGTPHIAAMTLELLIERGMTPSLVVTAPATPQGRGLHMTDSAVAIVAKKFSIPCITPEKITPTVRLEIASYGAMDFFLVVAYAKILPQVLLDSVHGKVLNIHPSLLPLYRGPSPLESVLLSNDTTTGVTLMELDVLIDHGPIVAQATWTLEEQTTRHTLEQHCAREGVQLITNTIDAYITGTVQLQQQDHTKATHTRKYVKSDGDVGLLDSIHTIHNPQDGGTISNSQTRTEMTTENMSTETKTFSHNREIWHIFRALGDRGWVSCTTTYRGQPLRVKITQASFVDGVFIIEEVIPENKKAMSFEVFAQWLQS